MPGDLRRRVERLEQTAGTPGERMFGLCFIPSDCADPVAFEEEASAKARQDGVQTLFVIRFIKPGDVAPPVGVMH